MSCVEIYPSSGDERRWAKDKSQGERDEKEDHNIRLQRWLNAYLDGHLGVEIGNGRHYGVTLHEMDLFE